MFGTFPKRFQSVVAPFVKDKRVVDLGSGDGDRADAIERLGATVLEVDAGEWAHHHRTKRRILHGFFDNQSVFAEVARFRPDVAHVAWPSSQTAHGLTELIDEIPRVVYVGKTTDGLICGSPTLYRRFLHRPILATDSDAHNTLVVYGPVGEKRRRPTVDERAGIDLSKMYRADGSVLGGVDRTVAIVKAVATAGRMKRKARKRQSESVPVSYGALFRLAEILGFSDYEEGK